MPKPKTAPPSEITTRPVMESRVVEIGGPLAQQWLDSYNIDNRPIYPSLWKGYTRDILSPKGWDQNGESIIFAVDENGIVHCADGQHRLLGIVAADKERPGITATSVVVTGVSMDSRSTIDIGRPRSFGDQLHMSGESHGPKLAAILRRIYLWEHGFPMHVSKEGVTPTMRELQETLIAHPEARTSTNFGSNGGHRAMTYPSVLGFTHWLFTQTNPDPEISQWFMDRVVDGAVGEEHHPVLVLRARLLTEKAKRPSCGADATVALYVLAWNHYRLGNRYKGLQLPKGGLKTANFPMPLV